MGDDYWDWKVALSKEVSWVTFEVAYTDTDDASVGDLDDSRLIFTLSTSL